MKHNRRAFIMHGLALWIVLLFVDNVAGLDATASVTIDQLPAYSLQRLCGKGCVQNNYDGGVDLQAVLGCTWNGCYCGTQYTAQATSIIKSCWSAYCGTKLVSEDISTALSVYDGYCAGDAELGGGNAATTTELRVATTTATPNAATSVVDVASLPSSASRTVIADVYIRSTSSSTSTIRPSPTGTSTAAVSARDGLSKSDQIALGVGIGIGLPTLLVGIIALIIQIKRRVFG